MTRSCYQVLSLLCLLVGAVFVVPSFALAQAASPSSSAFLTGNWWGARTWLADQGLTPDFTEAVEVFGNPTGGISQGVIVEGLFSMSLDADFEKMTNIHGLTAHASAFQIHGHGMSAANLNNNILTVSNIEAERATRLFELWAQQDLLDGKISLRAGQLAADTEFATSGHSALYLNSAFGWATLTATDLPSGGAAYPLATPGARIRLAPTDALSFQAAVLNGDPAGGADSSLSPQQKNASGTLFSTDQDAFVIAEITYAPQGKDATHIPGTFKFGGWYHDGNFADQRFGTDGLSLADPASNGAAVMHHGNYGLYVMTDQTLWQDSEKNSRAIAFFARFSAAPDGRNQVSQSLDTGLNFAGFIPNRDDDAFGIGFAYARIGQAARQYDDDARAAAGAPFPVRSYEGVIEATYKAAITPWFEVQPDIQYVMNPGGYIADPRDVSGVSAIDSALVVGVRSVIKF